MTSVTEKIAGPRPEDRLVVCFTNGCSGAAAWRVLLSLGEDPSKQFGPCCGYCEACKAELEGWSQSRLRALFLPDAVWEKVKPPAWAKRACVRVGFERIQPGDRAAPRQTKTTFKAETQALRKTDPS